MDTIYIVSDIHLGPTSSLNPQIAKKNFITFLNGIESKSKLFILGDLFNFYLKKGNNLIFGDKQILKLLNKQIRRGIKITIFSGNHDFWLEKSIRAYGINFIRFNQIIEYKNKKIFLSHGDLYFKGNNLISLINLFSKSYLFYVIARAIPEDVLFKIIKFASLREHNPIKSVNPYIDFCKKNKYDLFIFGHYHTTDTVKCNNKLLITPGDFATKNSYIKIKNRKIYIMKGKKTIYAIPLK